MLYRLGRREVINTTRFDKLVTPRNECRNYSRRPVPLWVPTGKMLEQCWNDNG